MALNNTATYINDLINAGPDAQSNLYYLAFYGKRLDELGEAFQQGLTVRSSQITLPTATHGIQTNHFMTVSVDLPKAEIQLDKKISITFRVDANYKAYKYLLEQQAKTSVANMGYASNDVPLGIQDGGLLIKLFSLRQGITEDTINTDSGKYKPLYQFRNCWIKEITPLSYNYDSTDAQTVTVTIVFFDYDDPQDMVTL